MFYQSKLANYIFSSSVLKYHKLTEQKKSKQKLKELLIYIYLKIIYTQRFYPHLRD